MRSIIKALAAFVCAAALCTVSIVPTVMAESAAGSSNDGPANPNANQAARNILNYMRDISFSEQTIVGAFNWPDITGYGSMSAEQNRDHDLFIEKKYGFRPGILELHFPFENLESTQYVYDYTVSQAVRGYKEGKIPFIHFGNQWEYVLMRKYSTVYTSNQNLFLRNFDGSYAERDMDLYNEFLAIRKQWGDGLQKLKDAGVTALFRPFAEMTNHPGFRTYTEEGWQHFKNIWRQTFDYLVNERKLDNVLFGFAPLLPVTNDSYIVPDDFNYYPGNDVVDFICPTMYPTGENGLEQFRIRGWDYSKYMATGKPFGISELGYQLALENPDADPLPSVGTRSDYGRFMSDMKKMLPRTCFVVLWTQTLLYPAAKNVEAFLQDPRVLSADDLPQLWEDVYPAVGDMMTDSKPNFGGGDRQTLADGRYSLAQLKQTGYDPTKVSSLRLAGDKSVTFYTEDGCKGSGWMFIEDVPDMSAYGYDGSKVKSIEIKSIDRQQVSLGKPATSSSPDEDASLANDGETTSWETNSGTSSWLTVDLQGVHLLNRWEVKHAGTIDRNDEANTYNYRLQYSMDGNDWKDADVVLGNKLDRTAQDIAQVKARYVRLYIDKPNSEIEEQYQSYACIVDWGVYGIKVAQKLANTDPVEPTPRPTERPSTGDTDSVTEPTEPEETPTTGESTENTEPTDLDSTRTTGTTVPSKATDVPESRSYLPWLIGGVVVIVAAAGVTVMVLLRKRVSKE